MTRAAGKIFQYAPIFFKNVERMPEADGKESALSRLKFFFCCLK
jgi:hypothetical protein